ncbi:hypothetical protein LGN20_07485 [Burkholderia cepacia]|uniref:hypothetical protein n=1 Tax=Burkholderia cepacia TaxID=292 RepID=UPI001CF3E1F1|nr:hypothetical protein [Burkholderia cepacia]MCA8213745.1 hypothetical protein [Burkholderia cepacia]
MSEIITIIHDVLSSIPNVVWSGIVASIITVMGVLVTNLGLSKRHREQLAHTASESVVKREMELRRDIYMPAIEAAVNAASAIGSLSNPATSHDDVNEKYTDAAAKIGKASAIAKPATVRTLGTLTSNMRDLYTKLLIARQPIMNAQIRMSAAVALIERNSQDRDRWNQSRLDVMYNEGANRERDAFLVRQVEFCNRMIEHWTIQRDEAWLELSSTQLIFLRQMLALYPNTAQAMAAACVAFREDFDFEGDDIEAVRQAFADNATKATQFLHATITGLEVSLQMHAQAFEKAQAQRQAQAQAQGQQNAAA